MERGSLEDMMFAVENRIAELQQGIINSATEICSSVDDEDTEIDNIVGWLQEHETAYNDFNLFFEGREDEFSLDALIGWIADHDQLCKDFCKRFPELAEEHGVTCDVNSSTNIAVEELSEDLETIEAASDTYINDFDREIHSELIGRDIGIEDVTLVAAPTKFIITVNMENGEEFDFDVPFNDITCQEETLEDDVNYVADEIETSLVE